MRPFNLKQAKQGKKVCTMGGNPARIICFDRNGDEPIVALVDKLHYEIEEVFEYFSDGRYLITKEHYLDLMMED